MDEQVPARAVRIYEETFRRLAAEFPEFAFWANLVDHQATRAEIRELRTALAGLAADLSAITTSRVPDPVRVELARAHRAVLRRPALQTDQPTGDLTIPTVHDSYINPDFRCATDVPTESVVDRGWWSLQPRRCDLQQFLVGFLTNPAAQVSPLLVLGQPGSGKSLFTQVLAARLPPEDFLTVRVPLREVTADTDLQTQIEQAIRATTGESLTWPQLIRTAEGALPVVLFDGFDELLQESAGWVAVARVRVGGR